VYRLRALLLTAMVAVTLVLLLLPRVQVRPPEEPEGHAAASLHATGSPSAPAQPSPAPSALAPVPARTPTPTAALPAAEPDRLEVPSIGVRTGRLIGLGLGRDGSLEVPGDGATAGWFTGAPSPGQTGPAVVAGHVDYDQEPGVFFRLHELRPGAEAIVHRRDGTTVVFTVYRVEHYPKATFPTDRVYGDTAVPELRLITCGRDFDRWSRQYVENVVAYGKFTRAFR
jgi:sortase (surface protein transpeptidase)